MTRPYARLPAESRTAWSRAILREVTEIDYEACLLLDHVRVVAYG
jgi:hypothetical protein